MKHAGMSQHRTDKEVYVTDCENVKSIGTLGQADSGGHSSALRNTGVDMAIPQSPVMS